jgi:hypothetical protein
MASGKKSKRGGKPSRPQPNKAHSPAAVAAPPGMEAVLEQIRQLGNDEEGGWGVIAEALKSQPELEPQVMFEFLARHLGKEVLPLLRGAALDEDDTFALGALRALALLPTRAAGEILAEAYAAHPEGERGNVARVSVDALQARGIKISIPETDTGARPAVPKYQIREILESLPDAVGGCETLVRLQDRYGVWSTVAVIWNDRAGVKNGFITPFSRPHWEEMVRTQRAQGVELIPVPEDYARWHVRVARDLNAKTGLELGDHLEGWDSLFGEPADGYTPPDPTAPVRELPEEEQRRLAAEIEVLMADGLLSSWAFEPADCLPFQERYKELAAQVYAVPEDQQQEGPAYTEFQNLLSETARSILTPEMDAMFRERLRDAARKFEWQGNERNARILAAVVLELESLEDPAESQFYRELAANGFELLQEIQDDGEDPEALRYDPMEVYTDEAEA